MNYIKYPRTLHFPWSSGITNDDRVMNMDDVMFNFHHRQVILTEKMDGENTTMYRDHIHARSIDSSNHPSRNWVKGLHGKIRFDIPAGWRICGENLYAKHSLFYTDLESYFMVFSIWNNNNECLSIDDTLDWCRLLDLAFVPVLYRGQFNLKLIQELKIDPNLQEGYVCRNVVGFHYSNFSKNVAKYVRPDHVQYDEQHWSSKPIIKNLLKI